MTRQGASKLRIVVAEDHHMVREFLTSFLGAEGEFQLVGEASSGLEALRLVAASRPDILILDLMLPDVNGLEVARQVKTRSPRTRVVVLSAHADEPYVDEALRNGVAAYVLKGARASELVAAVRAAAAGQRYLSPPLSEEALRAYRLRTAGGSVDLYETLTTREREVFQLLAQGKSNPEIADLLCISRRTVESHCSSLMRKLNLKKRAQVVRYALRRGLRFEP